MDRTRPSAPSLLLLALALLGATGCGGGSATGPGSVVRTAPPDPDTPPSAPPLPTANQLRRAFGSLNVGRYGHTATLLTDGTVLVAGGTLQGTLLTDRAELFEPSSENMSELAGRMLLARTNHTATRLTDGRVLLVGGWHEAALGQLAPTARAEIYDPVARAFVETGAMTRARVDHAAVRLANGRVLVTGGSVLEGTFLRDLDDAEVFDPVAGRFTALTARMAHTHATHALLDVGTGKYLVAGGSDVDLRLEVFTASTGTFSALPPLVGDGARYNACGATFLTGGAVLAGGSVEGSVLSILPGGTFAQSTGSPLRQPRAFATATRVADNQILVAGGVDFTDGGLLLPTCDLIVEGGPGGARTYPTVLRFNLGMAAHTATRLSSGRVMFCGGLGSDAQQNGLVDVYVFTP